MLSPPRQASLFAAFVATCLVAAVAHAGPQSSPPPGDANTAAGQTALAIAGVAAMKPAVASDPSAQPSEAGPVVAPASASSAAPARSAARPMTAEQRQQFMML